MKREHLHAFTLIELLIVVAIIAILAAIALPNFLEAHTRAKVSRARADLRTLATALEAYRTDYNAYPVFMDGALEMIRPVSRRMIPLTTPISFITSLPRRDVFPDKTIDDIVDTYDYAEAASFARRGDTQPSYRTRGAEWRLSSSGPDGVNTWGGPLSINPIDNPGFDYDPTNGTTSNGDIVRVGPRSGYAGNFLYPNGIY